MRDQDATKEKVATWERHWQTILLAVITAALMFTGKFMWEVNSQLSTIVAENKALTLTIAELKGAITAMQNNYMTRNEFSPYADRIKNLEDRRR